MVTDQQVALLRQRQMEGKKQQEESGTGLAPHREAKAASECSRSGLLPAATRMAAAVSGPMPKMLTRAGAAIRVSRSSSDRRSRISLSS